MWHTQDFMQEMRDLFYGKLIFHEDWLSNENLLRKMSKIPKFLGLNFLTLDKSHKRCIKSLLLSL